MRYRIFIVTLLIFFVRPFPNQSTCAAPWIAPDWAGKAPNFPPGSLFWKTNNYRRCTVLYRTVLKVDNKPLVFAGLRIRASWFNYIFLNGHQIASYLQKGEGATTNPLDVELTHLLRPGRNVLIVSTTPDGFSLDGGVGYHDGSVQRFSSVAFRWKAQKFPPLTMLEYEPCMKPDFDDADWFSVKALSREQVTISDQALREICQRFGAARLAQLDNDARWRLKMLAEKGIAIVDWEAYGWGGAARLSNESLPKVLNLAKLASDARSPGECRQLAEALTRYVRLNDEATNSENYVVGLQALKAPAEEVTACQSAAYALRSALELMTAAIRKREYAKAVAVAAKGEAAMTEARKARVINDLCSCLDNKFGWFDNNALLDNDIANWGVRVNRIVISWRMNLDGKWRFKTDPDNVGVEEKRHTLGYNIEDQWTELRVPGSWETQGVQENNPKAVAQSPYPGVNERTDGPYNGYAWYRKTLRVPKEWAGYDIELHVSRIDDWDWTYFNDKEIGRTGAKTKGWWRAPRKYKIPKAVVHFGGYNVIAFRIYDCGAEGVLGSVELRCPGLKEAFENKPQAERRSTTVFASPLSSAALLTVGENALVLWGWDQRGVPGPSALWTILHGKLTAREPGRDGIVYDRARDGELDENWVLLASDASSGGDKSIELVFLKRPVSIAFKAGRRGASEISVTFDEPGARLLAVRPLQTGARRDDHSDEMERRAETCRFWSRALLSYPVTFSEAFVRDPQDKWALSVADVYNYWKLEDDWGDEPITVAPLPPLVSYGLKTRYPGLKVISRTQDLGRLTGEWGDQIAAVGQNYILYRVPLDPIKRFGGFTSFCFSGADIGVPGNIKEIETIKRTGANTYRPQHNQNGKRAMDVVQWCWEQGIQNVFNVDGAYAAKESIFDHYRKLAEQCKDYPPDAVAYDLINEPANMEPSYYNPRVKKITEIIRAIDKTHLIYVETPHSFASVTQFANLQPTGDELTCYSFHDYDYRLPSRWPNENHDIRDIIAHYLPAFKFSIKHRRSIHLGEFGGFEQTKQSIYDNRCAVTLLMDFFKIFDQFGWHWHYYANRGIVRVREDGSLQESYVQGAYRRYFAKGTFNVNRP